MKNFFRKVAFGIGPNEEVPSDPLNWALNQVNEMLREISYKKEQIEQDVDYHESSPIMDESHNGNISDDDVFTWIKSLNDQELFTLKKLIKLIFIEKI